MLQDDARKTVLVGSVADFLQPPELLSREYAHKYCLMRTVTFVRVTSGECYSYCEHRFIILSSQWLNYWVSNYTKSQIYGPSASIAHCFLYFLSFMPPFLEENSAISTRYSYSSKYVYKNPQGGILQFHPF